MQRTWMLAAAAGVLAAGCSEGEPAFEPGATEAVRVAERLRCPEREGELRRVSTSADGRACAYRGSGGAEVELRLATAGDLAALDAELRALAPAGDAADPAEPPPVPTGPEEDGATSGQTQSTEWSIRVNSGSFSWESRGGTPTGAGSVDSWKRDHEAAMRAHEAAMEVHDAAMKAAHVGEAGEAGDVSSSLLLRGAEPGPDGWRVAGYRARGAGAGLRVVGVLRARGGDGGGMMDDIEALVNRNVEL